MKRVSTPNIGSSSGTIRSDQLILVPARCIVQGGDFVSDHFGEFRCAHDTKKVEENLRINHHKMRDTRSVLPRETSDDECA